jgi:hypothetical protein
VSDDKSVDLLDKILIKTSEWKNWKFKLPQENLKMKACSPSGVSAPCYTHTAQSLNHLAGIRFTRVYKKWESELWGGLHGYAKKSYPSCKIQFSKQRVLVH